MTPAANPRQVAAAAVLPKLPGCFTWAGAACFANGKRLGLGVKMRQTLESGPLRPRRGEIPKPVRRV